MSFEFYERIDNLECNLCSKPAKVVYVRSFLGIFRMRYYCQECAKKVAIIRREK